MLVNLWLGVLETRIAIGSVQWMMVNMCWRCSMASNGLSVRAWHSALSLRVTVLGALDVSCRCCLEEAVVIDQAGSIGMVGSCRADMLLGRCCYSIQSGQKSVVGVLVVLGWMVWLEDRDDDLIPWTWQCDGRALTCLGSLLNCFRCLP